MAPRVAMAQPRTPSPRRPDSPTEDSQARQLPLAPSPLSTLDTFGSVGRLLPKIRVALSKEQTQLLARLEAKYQTAKKALATAPSSTIAESPRLPSERSIDGARLLSLKLAELQAGLELTQEIGRALRKQWHEGDLHIKESEYNKVLDTNESQLNSFLSQACTIRSHRQTILGIVDDDSRMLRIEVQNDWAHIDGILRALRNLYNARKTLKSTKPGNTQARFRKSLIQAYDASQSKKTPLASLWCPIAGQFELGSRIRAAHIVKKNVGENTAQALFGVNEDAQGHIWQPSNGLLVLDQYEKWLDAGVIVVVPDDDDDNEFKVVVLDMSAFDDDITYPFPVGAELDGRRLQFRGSFRPQKRYLYFKMAVTLLHRQRADVPSASFDRSKLPDKAKELWLTPGSYLTGSVLFSLARQIGYMSAGEAAEFWGMERGSMPAEAGELANTFAMELQVALNSDSEGGVESHLRRKARSIKRRKAAAGVADDEEDEEDDEDDEDDEDEEDEDEDEDDDEEDDDEEDDGEEKDDGPVWA